MIRFSLLASNLVYPRLDKSSGHLSYPIMLGAILSSICYLISLVTPFIDKKGDKIIKKY